MLHALSNPIKPICLGYFSEILFVEEYNICASSCILFLNIVLVLNMVCYIYNNVRVFLQEYFTSKELHWLHKR